MTDLDLALRLLTDLVLPPGEQLPGGTDRERIDRASAKIGLPFPDELIEWLLACNGPCVGPGGVFGVDTARASLDIAHKMTLFPSWTAKGWLPVAGDGCGNYYVLLTADSGNPVAFVDACSDEHEVAYVVATTFGKFLVALLRKELGQELGWPFDSKTVLGRDPLLARLSPRLRLPWD